MLKKKIAFIIGVTGQDGSYLSSILIKLYSKRLLYLGPVEEKIINCD